MAPTARGSAHCARADRDGVLDDIVPFTGKVAAE
jgi:hypothetical protein